MKPLQPILAFTGSVLLAAFILSCSKTSPNLDPRDGSVTFNCCRIAQTTNGTAVRNFTYNSNNDPVSVQSAVVGTGTPNLLFRYNKKGQLIEYSGLYSNGSFEFMHVYGYKNGRITTDTTYTLGPYSNPSAAFSKRYSYLSYDALNRVVEDSEIHLFPLTITNVLHYNYDVNGNLVTGAVAGYDDKMNPHRTNKVWMLVDRNYSVNNPLGATSYNSVGLPLTLQAPPKFSLIMILGSFYYYGSMSIAYDCQ
ncbi:MAG TPA: hypothetical protein VL307_17135 [Chitinophagaceae bacterium]|nr:hypothetical protein [Chitinophagaceae bacterium]